MIFQFYFKRMQSSEFLKNLSQRKLTDVIERFVGQSGLVHLTFFQEKNEHKVQCRLHSWNGTVMHASGADENLYAAIDHVAQKLEAQLSRQKMRFHRKMRLQPIRQASSLKREGTRLPLWTDEAEPLTTRSYRLLN